MEIALRSCLAARCPLTFWPLPHRHFRRASSDQHDRLSQLYRLASLRFFCLPELRLWRLLRLIVILTSRRTPAPKSQQNQHLLPQRTVTVPASCSAMSDGVR